MKKKFTFLMAAFMLLTMILPWKALGQERGSQKSTLTFTAACGGSGTADDDAEWAVTSDGTESTYDKDKGIHYGTSSAQVKYIQLSTSDILGNITKVVVNASTASGVSATVGVTVGESNFGGDTQSLTSSAANYTFEGSASGDIVVLITKPSKATKALYCKSIEVTYTPSHTLTYSATTGGSITSVMNGSTSVSSGGKVVEGTTLNIEAAAESGYVFAGWTQTGTGNSFGNASNLSTTFTMGTANATITANFAETPTDPFFTASDVILAYNVTAGSIAYTVNNPVQGGVVTAEITGGNEGSWLSRGDVTSTSVPLTCSANNMGQRAATVTLTYTYNTNQTVTKDVTVTQDPAKFTITFHGNNGKTAGNDEEYTQTNVVYGIATALTANEFTRDGYFFNSWNTEADGSGDDSYIDQDEVTLTSDLDLYAQWTIIPTYTLVTDVNQIVPGAHYLIVSSITAGDAYAMGSQNSGQYRNRDDVKIVDNSGTISITKEGLYEFVLSGYAEENTYKWTFYDKTNAGYLYASSSSRNYLETQSTNDDNGNWSIEIDPDDYTAAIVAQGTNTKKKIQHNSSATRFSCYSTDQGSVYLYKKDNDTNIEFYSDSKIAGNIAVGQDLTLTNAITIENGGTLNMGENTLSTSTGGFLTIEDGGQLILRKDHPAVSITAHKTVAAPATWNADTKTGWYAISSTVGDITDTDLGDVTNLTPATVGNVTQYDLYKYVEGQGWINQHAHNSDFGGLQNGHGYLYARKEGATLSFSGNVTTSDVVLSDLTADGTGSLKGIHFIGNPFTHNIYKSVAVSADAGSGHAVSTGFYKLNESSQWVAVADNAEAIKPGQGFLVEVTAGTTLTIKNDASVPAGKSNNDYIRFTVANSQYEDVAYAWFDKGLGLGKVNHRNNEAPMLYINQNGNNYAIATMDDNTESFNLNFKAMATGKYTLGYDTKGNYSYLHIIDRMTGEDVDMLMEDKYSFIGSPQDNAERFIVKLSYNNGSSTGSEAFAYQSGNEIIVNGEGTLEVYDVTGRKVMTTTINGVQTVNGLNNGFYIFRLNEKTQKIVVK